MLINADHCPKMTITFLTVNAKGLNHPVKRKSLWTEAIRFNCDVLCTQETHFHSNKLPTCTHPKYPHVFKANAPAKKRGVMTAIRDTVAFKLHNEIADSQGRYHILVCDINSTTYTVVNIYAPNDHQICFVKMRLMTTKYAL